MLIYRIPHSRGILKSVVGGERRDGKHRSSLRFTGEHKFNATIIVLLRLLSRSFWRNVAKYINMGGYKPGFLFSLLPGRKLVLFQGHQIFQLPHLPIPEILRLQWPWTDRE